MHRTEPILSWENRGRAGAEGTCVQYSGSAVEGELRWRKCTEAKYYREGSDFEEMDWDMR